MISKGKLEYLKKIVKIYEEEIENEKKFINWIRWLEKWQVRN